MDSLIQTAARALASGDPLAALNWVALRNDPHALALRGIAMARLGDLSRAKALMRRAARAFGTKDPVARARCLVAEAEIAFAARELDWPAKTLDAARQTLADQGDHWNAAHALHLETRRLLLTGRLDEAEQRLATLNPQPLPPPLRAIHELIVAGIAIKRLQTKTARAALALAARASARAGIPALVAEVSCTPCSMHRLNRKQPKKACRNSPRQAPPSSPARTRGRARPGSSTRLAIRKRSRANR